MNTKLIQLESVSGNTAEFVAAALRNDILSGRLKANQPLRQDQIAEEYGVSKVPVREALVQLKGEGLVTFKPNRGAVVTVLSPFEVDEIFTMRIALETAAIRRAIPQLKAADMIRADGVLEIIEQEEDRSKWSELNWEFHATLYQAARMPRLLGTIQTLHHNVGRYLVIYLSSPEYHDVSQREHRKILESCRRSDADSAAAHLESHLSGAASRLVNFLTQNNVR